MFPLHYQFLQIGQMKIAWGEIGKLRFDMYRSMKNGAQLIISFNTSAAEKKHGYVGSCAACI